MTPPPLATLEKLQAADPTWLEPLDLHLARPLGDLAAETDPSVRLALALANRQLRRGHVCLDIDAITAGPGPLDDEGQPLRVVSGREAHPVSGGAEPIGDAPGAGDAGEPLRWPERGAWLAALAVSPLVAVTTDGAPPATLPAEPRPLVLELPAGRLYLRRWWEHEAALAAALGRRAATPPEALSAELAAGLARLFPPLDGPAETGRREQAAAVALAAERRLAVITGGPGTGKTTTVLRLLALLVEAALAADRPAPRVLLLAPTGKAAARLEESVTGALERLAIEEAVRAALPREARTIHRALGVRGDGGWRHHAGDPLAADLVVVDEASMVDMALMRALVEALAPEVRLVLLGDRDQLASVEAGAVLADICGPPAPVGSPITPDPPIAACIARLSYSFRFGPDTGIGGLARAVNAGEAERVMELLADPTVPDVSLVGEAPVARDGRLQAALEDLVLEGYGAYLAALAGGTAGPELVTAVAADPAAVGAALAALGQFRVLCAHRQGPAGVSTVGRAIVESLARVGWISPLGEAWPGRPILITRNDPGLGLANGDVGLIAAAAELGGRARAFFATAEGPPRALAPPRLPPHETVFAMSIHKSQGSEFETVVVVLPNAASPLLSRELLYTAVTRARRRVVLFATPEALHAALARRADRASGLGARLWGGDRPVGPGRS